MNKKIVLLVGAAFVVVGGVLLSMGASKEKAYVPVTLAQATLEVRLADGARYPVTMSFVTKMLAGKEQKMLAYNGSVPGPTIRVKQGSEITIVFKNATDMKTLLHSHGVRLEDRYDGSQLVQKEMEPGETFEYKIKFPDAGVFWYHPHVRDDIQQVLGAYGNYIVEPNDPSEFPRVDREEVVTLGDVLLEDGQIAPYSQDFVTHALMGRYGNTMVVNGDTKPLAYSARPKEVVRFYLTNVSAVRPYNLMIPGAEMKLIGSDGGLYEEIKMTQSVQIHPSERYIVDVRFPKEGKYTIEHRVPGGKTYTLGEITVAGAALESEAGAGFAALRKTEGILAKEFALARTFLTKQPDKKLQFTIKTDMNAIMGTMMRGHNMGGMDHSMMGHMHAVQPVEWEDGMGAMNTFSTNKNITWVLRDMDTGLENMDVNWNFTRGEWVKVRLFNDPKSEHPMQHPFHAHGNRFLVLATNGVPNDNLVWKDTTVVRAGDTVDILMDLSNPGKWMAHCHILEHLHSGMMIGYTVE